MWELYDRILSGMNDDVKVQDFLIGPRQAVVRSSSGSIGIAPVILERYDRFDFSWKPVPGVSLQEMASHLPSWNMQEAALALAAANAYYNDAAALPRDLETLPGGRRSRRVFSSFFESCAGDGHSVLVEPIYDSDELAAFPGRMEVIRKETDFRDYIPSAWPALIPPARRLILNGRSIVDKTAEGMIACAAAHDTDVIFFGADVPLCREMKECGVTQIRGMVFDQPEELMNLARYQMKRDDYLRYGHFVIM